MLVPAITHKSELESLFAKEVYTKDYFLYMGYRYGHSLPEIKAEDDVFQYAITDKGKVIGYLSYRVNTDNDSVVNFGLYSFDRGNPKIGIDLFAEMERLVKSHRRIEWIMVGGNPVQRHYDKFCERHGGNVVKLHDVYKDRDGNYRDEYIYEIVRKQVKHNE